MKKKGGFYVYCLIAYDSMQNDLKTNLNILCEKYSNMKYWCIYHNNDVDSNGDLKKPHYHIILDFNFNDANHSIKEREFICNLFNISISLFQNVRKPITNFKYLTHSEENDSSKSIYQVSDIITNDIDTYNYYIDLWQDNKCKLDKSLESSADALLENLFLWIDSHDDTISNFELMKYMRENKLFFKLSSVQRFIFMYLENHNSTIY